MPTEQLVASRASRSLRVAHAELDAPTRRIYRQHTHVDDLADRASVHASIRAPMWARHS
jgi:hypothetical protein